MKTKTTSYATARAFLADVGHVLYSRETVNNLILGVSERLVADPRAYQDPFFAAVKNEVGQVLVAAVMTPPHNMILAGDQDFHHGLSALIVYLQQHGISLPGVIGPVQISEEFVKRWEAKTKQAATITMHQRVYELRTVRTPALPGGHFRIALLPDTDQIAQWLQAFTQEALGEEAEPDPDRARALITAGSVFVWEKNARAVSMAMKIRPIAHSVTVSGVYTPPQQRSQGFATALVARLSQHLLESGYQFINLFTDLANPTSNSIYSKIGYHPVCDFRMYALQ